MRKELCYIWIRLIKTHKYYNETKWDYFTSSDQPSVILLLERPSDCHPASSVAVESRLECRLEPHNISLFYKAIFHAEICRWETKMMTSNLPTAGRARNMLHTHQLTLTLGMVEGGEAWCGAIIYPVEGNPIIWSLWPGLTSHHHHQLNVGADCQ